ncbi:MAG: hypothetical protein GVY36_20305 [Verrucomicrobia bacterium]|jgi:hypothetical protein|nr:hypothetical protein [Verrucomicrobiota bacterium]
MKKFTTTVSAAALVALTAPAGMASSILLDDFSTFQQVVDVAQAPETNTSTESGVGDFGADRKMTVITSGGGLEASTFTSTGGSGFVPSNTLTLINGTGQASDATLGYNFGGPVDLTMGGLNDKFFFEFPGGILSGDVTGSNFLTTVNSTSGSGTNTEALTPASSPFLSFSDADFASVDFENVKSLAFTFESVPSFDGSLNAISVVPLPASALLLLGGLGGFAGLSAANRRRGRKEA